MTGNKVSAFREPEWDGLIALQIDLTSDSTKIGLSVNQDKRLGRRLMKLANEVRHEQNYGPLSAPRGDIHAR